jgi:hypothetical protein
VKTGKYFYGALLGVALLSDCATSTHPPAPQISDVTFGGPIWSESQRRAHILFQDGGQAFEIPGGTLWTFGDSFIGQPEPGQKPSKASKITGARPTTIAFLPTAATNLPPDINYVTDADGVAKFAYGFLPGEAPERNRIWPLDGITLGSHTYLYYTVIEVEDKPGPWNFHGVGAGLAVTDDVHKQFIRLQPRGNWRFPITPSQVLREGNELFLFEISDNPKGLALARVATGEIENPDAYEFFTRDGWSHERGGAKAILKEAYGQVSIVWLKSRQTYLMATSSDFFHAQEIQLRESRKLEGPWSEPVRIPIPKFPGKKTNLIYCTFLHPELSDEKSGRIVATFCRTLDGDWELSNPEWMAFTLAPQ